MSDIVVNEVLLEIIPLVNTVTGTHADGIKLSMPKYSLDDNINAFIALEPGTAELVGLMLIRMACIARVNNGEFRT